MTISKYVALSIGARYPAAMHPWLSQQMTAARTEDWLRVAERRRRSADGRAAARRTVHLPRPTLAGTRSRAGLVLVRVGTRLAGPQATRLA